ncbi:hypothetical protein [Nostoc favosum]|uniref:Uncharacterized protein n=1 Tax=Nostoc favosum CHAB5714 TaxID=2780399 RepID=A0ABS8I9J0_9NOSO|nr:hypothetical protein [Nostoc favosum]MCC5600359.1 hypothetical protein [Nostoc favosum CHAB5714]
MKLKLDDYRTLLRTLVPVYETLRYRQLENHPYSVFSTRLWATASS